MDGAEGEKHPEWGARMMSRFGEDGSSLVLFHSRFYAKQFRVPPSKLCFADKLAIVMTPWWVFLPMAVATGEIREYVKLASEVRPDLKGKDERLQSIELVLAVTPEFRLRWHLYRQWYRDLEKYLREWVEEHKDGREDTWTPDARQARGDSGVWQ